jgi:hypothetical protein
MKNEELWILKPSQLTRGIGIDLFRNFSNVKEAIQRQDGCVEALRTPKWRTKSGEWVASRYIENPLLIEHKKWDFRIYVLVACLNPLQAFM